MIQSQSGSHFFQPPAYATWRSLFRHDALANAPRKIEPQR